MIYTPDFSGHGYNILFYTWISAEDSNQTTFKNNNIPFGDTYSI